MLFLMENGQTISNTHPAVSKTMAPKLDFYIAHLTNGRLEKEIWFVMKSQLNVSLSVQLLRRDLEGGLSYTKNLLLSFDCRNRALSFVPSVPPGLSHNSHLGYEVDEVYSFE